MKLGRVFRIIGAIAIACLMLGCSTLSTGSTGTGRVATSGQLRVGMSGDYPPMNARTLDGRLIGLDADLAAALASILKVELVLVELPIGELLGAVRSGTVDIAISGLTMTPRRNLDVAFAGPYYLARKAMLGAPAILEGVDNIRQLRGKGLRVAAVSGGTSEELVRRSLPDSNHLFVAGQDEAVNLVLEGKADVLIADDPLIRMAQLRNPSAGLTFVESTFSAEPIGIAVAPEDHLFVNLIENYLRSLEHIGLLDDLREKWLENDDWIGMLE